VTGLYSTPKKPPTLSFNYQIPEVSGELIADVAKTLANSPVSMSLARLAECYTGQFSPEYVRRAVVASAQMELTELKGAAYACSESQRDILRKASKPELKLAFRGGLQNYGPFLLFADYVSKGFSAMDAATRTKGLFAIQAVPDKIEKALRGWGKYAELIEETGTRLRIKVQTDHLLLDYVKKFVDSLEAELQAKLFTIDMLGPEIFTYLDTHEIKLDDIAKALRNYETDPKPSAARALEVFERLAHTLADEKGVNTQKSRGLMEWLEQLRSQKEVASNLLLLCHGMVGLRNMTHHNPDSETGIPWNISKQGALVGTLLVPIAIRTLYLYVMQRKQEF
jgi:hypothetical protein